MHQALRSRTAHLNQYQAATIGRAFDLPTRADRGRSIPSVVPSSGALLRVLGLGNSLPIGWSLPLRGRSWRNSHRRLLAQQEPGCASSATAGYQRAMHKAMARALSNSHSQAGAAMFC